MSGFLTFATCLHLSPNRSMPSNTTYFLPTSPAHAAAAKTSLGPFTLLLLPVFPGQAIFHILSSNQTFPSCRGIKTRDVQFSMTRVWPTLAQGSSNLGVSQGKSSYRNPKNTIYERKKKERQVEDEG